MKLLARILSHGFAIAIVLLLAIGLIYRGELFPEYDLPGYLDIGKLADDRKESTTTAEEGTPVPAPANDRDQGTIQAVAPESGGDIDSGDGSTDIVTTTDTAELTPAESEEILQEPAIEVPPVMPEDVVEGPEEGAASESLETLPEVPTQRQEEAHPASASGPAAAAVAVEEMPDESSDRPEDTTTALPESEPAIPQDTVSEAPSVKPQEKAYQLLAAAREAYWLRDYEVAESKYRDLISLEPENPDGYGELGNMYFSQGEWEQAASAYYDAGIKLVGQGLLDQAEELVAVIRGLNGGHADDLERKIKETRSTAD